MTLGFDFHPEARAEFIPDVARYDGRDDRLLIVAAAHVKRRPGYWRERVAST